MIICDSGASEKRVNGSGVCPGPLVKRSLGASHFQRCYQAFKSELNYFHGCFSTQSCSKGLRLSVAEEQLCMYHVVVLESHVRERKTLKEG